MRRSTSIHSPIHWRGQTFRCVHDITYFDVVKILEAADDLIHRPEVQSFVQDLWKGNAGWPPTSKNEPQRVWYEFLEKIRNGEPVPDNAIAILSTQTADGPHYAACPVKWKDRTFRCFHDVEPSDVIRILDDWLYGDSGPEEVHQFISDLEYSSRDWPRYTKEHTAYVLSFVMDLLEGLFNNPILPEDAGVLRQALDRSIEHHQEAATLLHLYFDGLDWRKRSEFLKPENYPST